MKFFNTAGPVKEEKHYLLDPLSRVDLEELMSLINQEKYFVLHAPRQTGKTSMLRALMHRINRQGHYRCVYINVEQGQVSREDIASAMAVILSELAFNADTYLQDDFFAKNRHQILADEDPKNALRAALSAWSKADKRPAVLLIDEIDALIGDTLVSVLRLHRSPRSISAKRGALRGSRCA